MNADKLLADDVVTVEQGSNLEHLLADDE